MKFKIEEYGSLRANADWEAGVFAEGSHREMGALGDGAKNAVRADIRKARFKNAGRLANAWRGKLFPRSPKAHAAKPAYVLGNNAANILDTFETGAVIKFKTFGLVPLAPAKRVKLRPGQPKTDLPAEVLKRYGAARFVSRRSKKNNQLQLGVYSGAEGAQKFIPCFALVKQVVVPDLLNAGKIVDEHAAAMPERHARGTWARFETALAAKGRERGVIERVTSAG